MTALLDQIAHHRRYTAAGVEDGVRTVAMASHAKVAAKAATRMVRRFEKQRAAALQPTKE